MKKSEFKNLHLPAKTGSDKRIDAVPDFHVVSYHTVVVLQSNLQNPRIKVLNLRCQ